MQNAQKQATKKTNFYFVRMLFLASFLFPFFTSPLIRAESSELSNKRKESNPQTTSQSTGWSWLQSKESEKSAAPSEKSFLSVLLSYSIFFVFYLFLFFIMSYLSSYLFDKKVLHHPNSKVDIYFESIRENTFFRIQALVFSFLIVFAVVVFYIAKVHFPYEDAFKITKLFGAVLLFNVFVFLLVVFFLVLNLFFSSSFFFHLNNFIHNPKPYNPILGIFFRNLPREMRVGFKSMAREDFLQCFFVLYESEPPPFSKDLFPPLFFSPRITKGAAFLMMACNLLGFYLILFSIYTRS